MRELRVAAIVDGFEANGFLQSGQVREHHGDRGRVQLRFKFKNPGLRCYINLTLTFAGEQVELSLDPGSSGGGEDHRAPVRRRGARAGRDVAVEYGDGA